jgi:uncharacterized protein (TIGR02001 family)
MKTKFHSINMSVLLMTLMFSASLYAQEPTEEKQSPISLNMDLVSSYVFRGSKVGSGPNLQPSMKFSKWGLTLGAWGSTSFQDFGDVAETDLYASYAFNFGLSVGLTDYYYFGYPAFQYTTDSASHALEVNLGYTLKSFSFSANIVVNDASKGGPANKPGGGDMYYEVAYAFKNFGVFVGAGNGWNTADTDTGEDVFGLCNIGMKATKAIKITEKYSIAVNGLLSVNPDKKELNFVVGLGF